MTPEQTPLLHGGSASTGVAGTAAAAPGPSPNPLRHHPRLPQNIGHRGYKAAFPENTMAAFRGALAAGAHALETDVHLSRDGVVVLSHDPTLKRCFGLDAKIADCDWAYLRTLQTLQEPRQGMPRLADLLEWLAASEAEEGEGQGQGQGREAVWVLLDVKTDDDPELLLPAIARTIAGVSVGGGGGRGWKERVVVGGWNENYINHARLHLPGYPLAYIGFSLLYARRFLSDDHPDVHFNLLQATLVGPLGARFRREVRKRGRRLFVWTVNDEGWMEWCVKKGVDGVITDQVGRYREVRDRFGSSMTGSDGSGGEVVVTRREGERQGITWPRKVRLYGKAILLQALAALFSLLFWHRLSTRGGGKGKGKGKLAGPAKT